MPATHTWKRYEHAGFGGRWSSPTDLETRCDLQKPQSRACWARLAIVGLGRTSCGLFADRRSGREAFGEGGVEERPGDLLGLLRGRCPHRLRLVTVLVPSAAQAVELSRRPVRGRVVEDGTQVAAECLVLAGPVGRPEAIRRQQRLARVVAGVVGDAVLDDDTGEERQLVQALLGLTQERGRTREVCGHDIETTRLDQ